MFLCVSLNPAIDKRLVVDRLIPGKIHRVRSVEAHAGGKAAHVAMVLRALGVRPRWIGLCGGAAGSELSEELQSLGIESNVFPVRGTTRTNLEILDDTGTVTEILEPGVTPSDDELTGFETRCGEMFKAAAQNGTVIFSGSLPSGTRPDLYKRLVAVANSFGCRTCLDTVGEPLRLALSAEPDFVKPNRDEAESLLGITIESPDVAARALRQILNVGARSAAISLGSEGMLYSSGKDSSVYFSPALKLSACSTVGCGDAALAGFGKSFSAGTFGEEALRLAIACASANCVAEFPGAVRLTEVEKYLGQVSIERMA